MRKLEHLMVLEDSDEVIDLYGDIRLFHNGWPRKEIELLLRCAAARVSRYTNGSVLHRHFMRGLLYSLPAEKDRKCIGFRLSVTGIKLLDYWAEKNKTFRILRDVYLTHERRREIITNCFMLIAEGKENTYLEQSAPIAPSFTVFQSADIMVSPDITPGSTITWSGGWVTTGT